MNGGTWLLCYLSFGMYRIKEKGKFFMDDYPITRTSYFATTSVVCLIVAMGSVFLIPSSVLIMRPVFYAAAILAVLGVHL